ncbi:Rod binding protein [Shimia gijangensis]|uniref:Rod binding protein n=2 Tax=Shimia gijangensis TaxID=1470563 RepID=A0A1M6QKB1_9RHOB|nr:Rod binding protein [Shimia gijangensis]
MIPPVSTIPQTTPTEMKLRNAAIELEANFLSEMLKGAGLGQSPDGFGGGTGEDQFSSLLRLEQARAMAKAGGIGLAETLYQALKDTSDDP